MNDTSDGGYLVPQLIDVDVSSPIRRLLVRMHLARPKIERQDVLAELFKAALKGPGPI